MNKLNKGVFKIIRLAEEYYVMSNKNIYDDICDLIGCRIGNSYELSDASVINKSFGIPANGRAIYFRTKVPINIVISKLKEKIAENLSEEIIPEIEYSDFRKYMSEHNKENLILLSRRNISMFTIFEEGSGSVIKNTIKKEILKKINDEKTLVLNI